MKTYRISRTDFEFSRIACGCMHLSSAWDDAPITDAEKSAAISLVETAVDQGITLFDHADIYARGKSELLFGEALRQLPGLRERIVLQSKCGIRFAGDPDPGSPRATTSAAATWCARWRASSSAWTRIISTCCCCIAPIR